LEDSCFTKLFEARYVQMTSGWLNSEAILKGPHRRCISVVSNTWFPPAAYILDPTFLRDTASIRSCTVLRTNSLYELMDSRLSVSVVLGVAMLQIQSF